MDIDIRIPIGLLFLILGALLSVYGLATFSMPEVYLKTNGWNLNLWTGGFMLVFGGIMLMTGWAGRKKKFSK